MTPHTGLLRSNRQPQLSSSCENRSNNEQVEEFVEKECIPAEALFSAQLGIGEQRWKTNPPVMEELKTKARKIGLWNMFLPKNHFSQGAGFSNLEYGLMAEYLGKSKVASEVSLPQDAGIFGLVVRGEC